MEDLPQAKNDVEPVVYSSYAAVGDATHDSTAAEHVWETVQATRAQQEQPVRTTREIIETPAPPSRRIRFKTFRMPHVSLPRWSHRSAPLPPSRSAW